MPQLPDAAALAEFAKIALLIVGTILALFGLGIYYGALRLFGGLLGATFGFLIFLANKEAFPLLGGFGPIFFGIVFALIGGAIGSWLAMMAHYTVFFLLGCIMGWVGILLYNGTITPDALATGTQAIRTIPGPMGAQWIVVVVAGVLYLLASNWMIVITCAIVGAAMVSTALDNRLFLYFGAPLAILFQWTVFLRHEHYRQPSRRQVVVVERDPGPRVIYDRSDPND